MYTVAIAQGVFDDETHNNWAGTGSRPVAWVVWYPACDNISGDRMAVPASSKDALFIILGGIIDAPVNRDRDSWPVVLLSHGTGGSAYGMDWIGHRLAQHGYIAVAVSHHGNTTQEPFLPEGFLCWWERAPDLTIALDGLSQKGPIAEAMDMSKVFALGFSLGAYTVLAMAGAHTHMHLFEEWLNQSPRKGPNGPKEFPDLSEHIPHLSATSAEFQASQCRQRDTYRDHRLKAVVAIAPPPPIRAFTPASLAAIDLPIHIFVGQADKEAPPEPCAIWLDKHLTNSSLTLLGINVGHYVFLNEATDFGKKAEPDICSDHVDVDRLDIHERTILAAVKYFDKAIEPRQ